MNKKESELIRLAIECADVTVAENAGGPFGAAVITPDGQVVVASNTVLRSKDPTCHAEVNVIRKTCALLDTHDLTGCILYTTCYPCPMCLSACIWANIKEVYYGADPEDAAKIGFRDSYIYDFIKGDNKDKSVLNLLQIEDTSPCVKMFARYAENNKTMY